MGNDAARGGSMQAGAAAQNGIAGYGGGAMPLGVSGAWAEEGVAVAMEAGHGAGRYALRVWDPQQEGTLAEEDVRQLWERTRQEGLHETVFYDGGVTCASDFVQLVAPGRAWLYRIDRAGGGAGADGVGAADTVAYCWCNGFMGRVACIHFCIFREGWAESVAIGRMATQFLLQCAGGDGEPLLHALVGVTPAPYRHALALVDALGFRRVGRIPGAAVLVRRGGRRVVEGVVSVLTR